MKTEVLILAGGLGTRMIEKTRTLPKPMVEIGNKPMLMHIMDIYLKYNFNNFIISAGYKQEVIKRYFYELHKLNSDLDFNFRAKSQSSLQTLSHSSLNFRVKILDTGTKSMTAGRILNAKNFLSKTFCATYGDGLGNVNIKNLMKFHLEHGKIATLTVVRQPSRFGKITISNTGKIKKFSEKSLENESWINAGFFVFNKKILNYITDDLESLESDVIPRLIEENQLEAFKHEGYWIGVDSLRDLNQVSNLLENSSPPWLN